MYLGSLISARRRFSSLWRSEGLRSQLLRGGAGSIALKLTHTILTIGVAVVLARTLGADGYGVYAFVFALINVFALPATMGLPQLIIRETAKAKSQGDWGLMRGLWRWSSLATLVFALIIAGAVLLVLSVFGENMSTLRVDTLFAGLIMVPLIALARLRDGALRGLGHVLLGQLSESTIRPALFLLLICAATMATGLALDAASVMLVHAVAAGVAFGVGAVLLKKFRPKGLRARPAPAYESRAWLGSATPLALIAGLNLINQHTDILLLGLFRSDSEVGVYRVVVQGAMLVAFGLQAVNMVVQPQFARLYHRGEHSKLQELVTQSARGVLILAVPVVLLYLVAGKALLAFVFGADYSVGYSALAVLAIGQLINAAAGSVGGLLNMTGHERETMRGLLIAALANITLNLLLIPLYGGNGAAAATAISLGFWNILLWRSARRLLGVRSTALGF